MRLTPDQVEDVQTPVGGVLEQMADRAERHIGRKLTDSEYDRFSTKISDAVSDALIEVEFDAEP